jgi:Arm DNA-binding domain
LRHQLERYGMKKRLSPRTIRSFKPGKDKVRRGDVIMDDLAPNLGVRVLGTADRPEWTFVFVSRFPGEKSSARIAIGKFYRASGDTEAEKAAELASLQSARDKAWKWFNLLKDGRDPRLEAKRERDAELQKQAHTFKSVAEQFIKDKLPKERRGSDVEADIRREFMPIWEAQPILELDEQEIKRCIRAKAKTKQEQARNLLGHIKRLMQWAKDQDDYGLKVNPAAGIKASAVGIGKKLKREHRLNDTELGAFWRAASRLPSCLIFLSPSRVRFLN